jgi:hypothetical protein
VAHACEFLVAIDVEYVLPLYRLEGGFRICEDSHKWDGLKVGAIFANGFETGFLELVRNEFRGKIFAAGSGTASFEPVARKICDIGLDPSSRYRSLWVSRLRGGSKG